MITRNEFERRLSELREELLIRNNDEHYLVSHEPGGQIIQPTSVVGGGGDEGGLDAYYFKASILDTSTIRLQNIRYRYGKEMSSEIDAGGLRDVTITTAEDGTYYVYAQALYLPQFDRWDWSFECSEVDTHPDQEDSDLGYRAFREEIAAVEVLNGEVGSLTQIWPGHIISVEGRGV